MTRRRKQIVAGSIVALAIVIIAAAALAEQRAHRAATQHCVDELMAVTTRVYEGRWSTASADDLLGVGSSEHRVFTETYNILRSGAGGELRFSDRYEQAADSAWEGCDRIAEHGDYESIRLDLYDSTD